MKKLTSEEFFSKMQGGESRQKPGVAVTYILIEEDDQEYYTEWEFISEDNDLDQLEKAYQEYINN